VHELKDESTAIVDAIPLPVLVVDEDLRIFRANRAAGDLLDRSPESFMRMRGGDALECINATESDEGCGSTPACANCVVRTSVEAAAKGDSVARRKARMELVDGKRVIPMHLLVTAAPLPADGEPRFLLVLEDVNELIELKSIIPMCASCKKIRNDDDYWQSVESYFIHHLDVDFSHGLCPDCVRRLYPGFGR
jgi:PAS domain-containing protein